MSTSRFVMRAVYSASGGEDISLPLSSHSSVRALCGKREGFDDELAASANVPDEDLITSDAPWLHNAVRLAGHEFRCFFPPTSSKKPTAFFVGQSALVER